MAALFLSAQAAIDQAARDRLNRASRDSQASISLRIADNRGSTACGTSASSLAFSASIAAFSLSIILVITSSLRRQMGEPMTAECALPLSRPPRIYRTGRTMQFNARAKPQTIEALYAIADKQGWLVGETLEHALAALQRELALERQ
jgi:hypothetical protein